MMYKTISTGLVPICTSCGCHLGVVCVDESEVWDYVSANGCLCRTCSEKDLGVKAECKRQKALDFTNKALLLNKTCKKREQFARLFGYNSFDGFCQAAHYQGFRRYRKVNSDSGVRFYFNGRESNFVLSFDDWINTHKNKYSEDIVLDVIQEALVSDLTTTAKRYGMSYSWAKTLLYRNGWKYNHAGRRGGFYTKGNKEIKSSPVVTDELIERIKERKRIQKTKNED